LGRAVVIAARCELLPLFADTLVVVLDPAVSGPDVRGRYIVALECDDLAQRLARECQSGIAVQTLDRLDQTILKLPATGRPHNLRADSAIPRDRHPDCSLAGSASSFAPAFVD